MLPFASVRHSLRVVRAPPFDVQRAGAFRFHIQGDGTHQPFIAQMKSCMHGTEQGVAGHSTPLQCTPRSQGAGQLHAQLLHAFRTTMCVSIS